MIFTRNNLDQIIEDLTQMRMSAVKQKENCDYVKTLQAEYNDELEFLNESQYILKIAIDCLISINIRSRQYGNDCFQLIEDQKN